MNERKMLNAFTKQFKEECPDVYWHKWGDTFGGHKKPADVTAMSAGRGYMIEFKTQAGTLSEFQEWELIKYTQAGGRSLVAVFQTGNGSPRDIAWHNLRGDIIHRTEWYKGRYVNLHILFDMLDALYS